MKMRDEMQIRVHVRPDGPKTLLAFAVAGLVLGAAFGLGLSLVWWLQ